MSWQVVKMGDFLINRDLRFKPKDPEIKGLKRIEKIDFSGNIFISDKPSNTDMILVKKGDLVISGINVEKGAMAVYQGEDDITATIHYSSYEFDGTKIDLCYLKNFLKSKKFTNALKEQVPGGIKTEIKPKHILPLEVEIPTDIEDQRRIIRDFENYKDKIESIDIEHTHQLALLKKLRQQILQDAVQGKLVPQDPNDEPASELLERIKAEKEKLVREKKIKKEKPLPPIKPDEIQFEIPESWVWCRLKDTGIITGGGTPSMGNPDYWNGDIPWISPKDMNGEYIKDTLMKVTPKGIDNSSAKLIPKGSIIIVGRSGILKRKLPVAINEIDSTVNQDMKVIVPYIAEMNRFLQIMLFGMERIVLRDYVKFGMTVHSLRYDEFAGMPIPLPPFREQSRIIDKIKQLMTLCDELEQNIQQNQKYTQDLLQVTLKEALEPKNC